MGRIWNDDPIKSGRRKSPDGGPPRGVGLACNRVWFPVDRSLFRLTAVVTGRRQLRVTRNYFVEDAPAAKLLGAARRYYVRNKIGL
ncbi:hypothetical protein AGR1C_pAt40321 [Agrobacterium fabacearum TT111]|nr:hypothetical protein AGR1C_pAt40321 [Agrobacterium fabacearum TT111]